jgi:[acyl-carrier-protein] S-malonyltransferase
MQQAVPAGNGAMAAIIGLDDAAVIALCAAVAEGQVLSAVNFNAPGQVVIAGERSAVERATENAKAAGARRAMLLSVSVPSHCALMQPAAIELAQYLRDTDIAEPQTAVVNNVDVARYDGVSRIRDGLQRQLFNPVRWVETVQKLTGDGATTVVECGPGRVLSGLTKRIDRSVTSTCVDSAESLAAAIRQCNENIG